MEETMEKLWKQQALSITTNRSTFNAMVGNFQRHACWDSSGYVYILTAEHDGSNGTKRVAVYRSVNAGFDLSAGFTFQADTSTGYGFDENEIDDLTEFSAVLRNNKIYIVATFSDSISGGFGIILISYDINEKEFIKLDHRATIDGGSATPYVNSVDLSVTPSRAHGDIIASWLEYDTDQGPTIINRRWLRQMLPVSSIAGSGGIGFIDNSLPSGQYMYPSFMNNFDGDSDLWGIMKLQDISQGSEFSLINIPRSIIRGSTSGPNIITLGDSTVESFGNFKSLYNSKFNLELMAYWRILESPKAGWELVLGVRSPDGIFSSFSIVEFDYSNLGVIDISGDLPNVHPEVLLILDDMGGVYVIGSYPSPGSRSLSGSAGIGRIDDPFYNIALAYWASDDFDSLSGANYETVWNGEAERTQMRYLSAPDMFPAGDFSAIRSSKLFITCVDTYNHPAGQEVLYRD
jgi:hypothetical protein